ncbi:unnamed protein product [Phytophthora lilii]|uniref:Unnamed protein product n=1 Tax=Phytophthora lilii TaxID=2077276 RepID=A0A9W6U7N3_9STRA|nr:unnamed protein product [Phytophthora lilii]
MSSLDSTIPVAGVIRAPPMVCALIRPEEIKVPCPETEKLSWFIKRTAIARNPSLLASGGFGKVYCAKWRHIDVIMKEIPVSSDQDMERFSLEVELWRRLTHPNVVPFYGANHLEKPCFIVSKFAKKGTLSKFLQGENTKNKVWGKIFEAAEGLNYLHEQGVVHGGLKGSNIVVDSDGTAMLTDFGLSFLASGPTIVEQNPCTLGAMQWRAPEYAAKIATSPSFESDVYSLGMTIIEVIIGEDKFWSACLTDDAVRDQLQRAIADNSPVEKKNRSDETWLLEAR